MIQLQEEEKNIHEDNETKLDNSSDSFNKKMSYNNLEKLRKTIELLSKEHHIEIAKILKNNKIKLNENNNGIFINLNNVDNLIINQIQTYINFIKNQEIHITIDESKKENLENIYFNKE